MQSGDVPGKFGVIFEKIRVISGKTGPSRTRRPINTEKNAKKKASGSGLREKRPEAETQSVECEVKSPEPEV